MNEPLDRRRDPMFPKLTARQIDRLELRGAQYRTLDIDTPARFLGAGVYYATMERSLWMSAASSRQGSSCARRYQCWGFP